MAKFLNTDKKITLGNDSSNLTYRRPWSISTRRCCLYKTPCECGKVYIGETGRSMRERIKEHDRDIRLARTQNSAVSEHANETGHLPIWNEVKFIDRDPHWWPYTSDSIQSTGMVESKFFKHGCPRSRNTMQQTAEGTTCSQSTEGITAGWFVCQA